MTDIGPGGNETSSVRPKAGVILQPQSLEYSRLKRPRVTVTQWLIITYVCGGLPLAVGVATTVAYLLTYNQRLAMLGVFTIAAGLLLGVMGAITWVIWITQTRDYTSRRWWIHTVAAVLLLLANVPACVICKWAVGYWRVQVTNNAAIPMTVILNARVNRTTRTITSMAPGSRKWIYWRLGDKGESFFVTTSSANGGHFETFEIYLDGTGRGADVTISINPDGTMNPR